MADWITVTPFVASDVVRAEKFQDMWTNMYTLKNPVFTRQYLPGPASATWTFTSTASWANIDATYYQLAFTTYGNDVMFCAYIRATHSASSGGAVFRLMVDGVAVGNTLGLQNFVINAVDATPQTYCLGYIWESAAAGDHTASVQVLNQTVGTTTLYQSSNLSFWVMEF